LSQIDEVLALNLSLLLGREVVDAEDARASGASSKALTPAKPIKERIGNPWTALPTLARVVVMDMGLLLGSVVHVPAGYFDCETGM
jgi:hypothetical protein